MSTALLELRVFWGTTLLRIDHRSFPWSVTVGQGRGVDVFVASDDLPTNVFELVRVVDGVVLLAVGPGMSGEIAADGEVRRLSETDTVLGAEARAVVHYGGLTLALQFVEAVPAVPRFALRDLDHNFLQLLSASTAFHIAAIVTLLLMPYATASLREEPVAIDIVSDMLATARRPEAPPKPMPRTERCRGECNSGRKIAARRGAVGRPRMDAAERMRAMLGGSGLIGTSSKAPLATALADLTGARPPARSALGLLRLGVPSGPYGGTRGIASIPTRFSSAPAVDFAPRKSREALQLSTPEVSNALPREVIRRVVDHNRAQIRFCYEHELQRDQTLEGRVAVRWIIGATGDVVRAEISESTIASRVVEQCLRDAILRWRFPQPAGGGVVTVTYPFVFVAN